MGRAGRRFVTTGVAIALVAGISLFKPPSENAQAPAAVPAMEPVHVRKQELVIGVPMEPETLDSTVTAAQVAFTVLGNLMEGLVRPGPDGAVLPGVAERWEVVDQVEYTFHLRADALWSDGRPVTSHDFKYAWLRGLDPNRSAEYAYQLYYIQGAQEYHTLSPDTPDYDQKAAELRTNVAIETPDDRTLKVILTEPAVQWLALTAFPTYYPVRQDVAEAHGDRYGREAGTMVYNGPYQLESWTTGTGLELVKNPAYWGAEEVRLERATIRTLPDGVAAVQLFEAGALDRAVIPGPLSAPYRASGQLVTRVQPITWYLAVNQRRTDLQSPALRKALSLALDRRTLVRRLASDAEPAEGLVPPVIAAGPGRTFRDVAREHLPQASADRGALEHWQELLSERGVSSLTVELLVGDSALAKRNGQALQEMLQEALPGLTVTLEPVPFLTLLERTRTGAYTLAYTLAGADFDDAMTFLTNWTTTSPFNDAHWLNLEYDRLVRKARAAGESPVRLEALAEAERLLLDEAAVIPLYHPTISIVQKPWVQSVVDRAVGADLDLRDAWVETDVSDTAAMADGHGLAEPPLADAPPTDGSGR